MHIGAENVMGLLRPWPRPLVIALFQCDMLVLKVDEASSCIGQLRTSTRVALH